MDDSATMTLDFYLAAAKENLTKVRDRLRRRYRTIPAMPPTGMRSKYQGAVYVEAEGAVVEFRDGDPFSVYTRDARPLREAALVNNRSQRLELFSEIAGQLPVGRVVNVGAGFDVDPVLAFEGAGHEVISVDVLESVLAELRGRGARHTLACDIALLPEVLPGPVDYVIGNSVLGYARPHKVRAVVQALFDAMSVGGVFTFDMAPNPIYFEIAENRYPPLINATAPHPDRLAHFIERMGPEAGTAAFIVDYSCRNTAVSTAVLNVVRSEFERCGARCATGVTMLRGEEGGNWLCRTLRVAKHGNVTLTPLLSERDEVAVEKVWHPFVYLDRAQGERLARLLGIHTDQRADAWRVIEYVADAFSSGVDPTPDELTAVESQVDTDDIASRIRACVEGAALPTHRTTTEHQVQFTHAACCRGVFSRDIADMRIDQLYAAAAPSKQNGRKKSRRRV